MGSYQAIKALGRWLAFPIQLARSIGMEEAIFLLNFMFVSSDEEEWVERTSAQLEEETTLTYKQQTRVRDRLINLGLLEVRSNRVKHETFYRVIEERYDALVAILRRKREFDELTFGSNSTLPKVNSTNLPKGSSLIKKELEENNKRKEEEPPSSSVRKFEEELERKRQHKEQREARKRGERVFKNTTQSAVPYRPIAAKPPETWNWFAKMWKRYVDVFPVGRPEHWEILDKLYSEFSATGLEDRLSRWLDQRDHKTNAWSALEFLNECPLMEEEGSGGDVPLIVNEE